MREWLVIEPSWKHSVFGPKCAKPSGYIPRDVAEPLLGRAISQTTWFTKDEGEKMRSHPEWRTDEPVWSPLGFWSV